MTRGARMNIYLAAPFKYREGEGTIERDFGAPMTCPVCNGTKLWPREEAGEW